jgi:hypothetical protein
VRRNGVRAGSLGSDQVPAVGRTERPGHLELGEAEQRSDRGRLVGCDGLRGLLHAPARVVDAGYWPVSWPAVLIAYLLGEIGTIGSLIWLMWLISCVHCCGWRMLESSAETCLFAPYSGV